MQVRISNHNHSSAGRLLVHVPNHHHYAAGRLWVHVPNHHCAAGRLRVHIPNHHHCVAGSLQARVSNLHHCAAERLRVRIPNHSSVLQAGCGFMSLTATIMLQRGCRFKSLTTTIVLQVIHFWSGAAVRSVCSEADDSFSPLQLTVNRTLYIEFDNPRRALTQFWISLGGELTLTHRPRHMLYAFTYITFNTSIYIYYINYIYYIYYK